MPKQIALSNRAKTSKRVAGLSPRFSVGDIMEKSLCSTCFNYVGCSWHEDFEARDDWEAVATIVHDSGTGDYESFCVIRCPDYKPRPKMFKRFERVTIAEVADVLNVTRGTVYNYARHNTLAGHVGEHGYEIKARKNGRYKVYYLKVKQ